MGSSANHTELTPAAQSVSGLLSRLTLRRLKWTSIVAALGFILVLEVVRDALHMAIFSWQGRLLMDAVILTGAFFFLGATFHLIERIHERLERSNRELLALQAAALDIYGELDLDAVLQKVVDRASQLVDARYGALSVVDDQYQIESFVTSGITPEQRVRIGPPPVGHGLLGVVLHEGQRLRLADIGSDPRSHGFPPHHPAMRSLLAVPIVCKSPFRGNLYLAEKRGAEEFSQEDEETLVRFATTAAIAIDNAHLHQRLNTLAVAEERLRIAHEMHDGLAQVLAYVNTKAQAVKEFLRRGKAEQAADQLEQLAGAAREVYTDVREAIIGLRTTSPGQPMAQALAEYAATWESQNGIACRVAVEGEIRLPPSTEFQILRIVQEALANVRKHARAERVDISLRQGDSGVVLAVADDGVGFTQGGPGRGEFPRFGLSTMRERAESIGGTMELESEPGRGTRVRVEVPVQEAFGTAR